MKKKNLVFLLLFIFILFSTFSYAAATTANILDQVLSIFGGISIGQLYEKYDSVFDFVIYLLLFMGLTQATLGQRQPFKDHKMVPIILAVALAISLTWWGYQAGFSLRNLGPVAAIIFLLIFAVAIFRMITGLTDQNGQQEKALAASTAFMFVYLTMFAIMPSAMEWINENTPFFGAILSILFVVAIVVFIIKLIAIIKNVFGGGTRAGTIGNTGTSPQGEEGVITQTNEPTGASEQAAQEAINEEAQVLQNMETEERQIAGLLNQIISAYNQQNLQEMNDRLRELQAILNS